jgi:hypothetical protein
VRLFVHEGVPSKKQGAQPDRRRPDDQPDRTCCASPVSQVRIAIAPQASP